MSHLNKLIPLLSVARNRAIAHQTALIRPLSLSCVRSNQEGRHVPTDFDKKKMVWAGIFASEAEIPKAVREQQLRLGREWFRIRFSMVSVVLLLVCSGITMYFGRQQRDRGDVLMVQGVKFEAQQREIGHRMKEQEAKDSSS